MFYLVCFDIVEDRARYRVCKVLKDFGVRVQKSVFECSNMDEEKFLRMRDRMEEFIDDSQDSVRYYRLCGGCVQAVEFAGIGGPPVAEKYRVV